MDFMVHYFNWPFFTCLICIYLVDGLSMPEKAWCPPYLYPWRTTSNLLRRFERFAWHPCFARSETIFRELCCFLMNVPVHQCLHDDCWGPPMNRSSSDLPCGNSRARVSDRISSQYSSLSSIVFHCHELQTLRRSVLFYLPSGCAKASDIRWICRQGRWLASHHRRLW